MTTNVRNIVAVFAGFSIGAFVYMAIILLGSAVIPPPEGVDNSSMEERQATLHLMETEHYLLLFSAHAAVTLVGALAAYTMAASHRRVFAYAIGVVFLAFGSARVIMLPAPIWFEALDLLVAYIPMSWLAIQIGGRLVGQAAARPMDLAAGDRN